MKFCITVCVIILSATIASAQNEAIQDALDDIIQDINKLHSNNDTFKVPYKGMKYEKRFTIFVLSYELALKEIQIQGVYTHLRRVKPIQVNELVDGLYVIRTELVTGPLKFESEGVFEALGMSSTYDWKGDIYFVKMPITLHFNAHSSSLTVRHLLVDEVQGVSVSLEGRRSWWITNVIRNAVVGLAAGQFSSTLKDPIESLVIDELKEKFASHGKWQEVIKQFKRADDA